ncbi:arsenic resistance protein [Exiguobacterium sp. SH3S1]|uniref:arsenic resistance protein n=1 Tax=Exiguobacterium sp. SH3S1 TaxID=2510955 RepID=UPI001F276750|nr:arsenic resistance protein [Exiguobacterium sp. SH3S1]
MSRFEKLYPIFILLSVVTGLAFGTIETLRRIADGAIVPLLMAMLFFTFIQIPFAQIRHSFSNRTFTITSLVLNFVWTPVFAFALASVFLSDHPALWIGFIMLMVTPCTDWYIVFTGLAKGDVVASLSILPLNLVLQLALLPVYLYVLTGTSSVISVSVFLHSLAALAIPLGSAIGLRYFLAKSNQLQRLESVSLWPIILLSLAVMSIFASQGRLLIEHVSILGLLIAPLLLFFIVNFVISRRVGKKLLREDAAVTSLQMTTLARNSPIALAIATTAFPNEPLIALVLVIGPLIELPVLVAASFVIRRLNRAERRLG